MNEGTIVLAATNRADILDPALMRPGRFDRQVYVGYPDKKGREEILKVHAKNKPLGPDVDLSVIAKSTYGFTGADLENLLNEAALLAARENKKEINQCHLDDAMLKVVMGPEKKSKEMQEKDKKQESEEKDKKEQIEDYQLLRALDLVKALSLYKNGLQTLVSILAEACVF